LSALLTIKPPGSTTTLSKITVIADLTFMFFSDAKAIKPVQKFDYSTEYKTINAFCKIGAAFNTHFSFD
jgi:hypothetical protein